MDKFDGKLEFDITLIPCEGSDTWVENTLGKIHQCLNSDIEPKVDVSYDFCAHRDTVDEALK